MSKLLPALLLALIPGICFGGPAELPELPAPAIQVDSRDGVVVLDLSYHVPVFPSEAWDVLTDFENMPAFIPNLESSRVLQRNGRIIQLEQKGKVRLGILPVHYESTRELEAIPHQSIRAHSLSGNTRMESLMQLSLADGGTQISYHVTAEPDLPVPRSLVSAYISRMLESQFKAMGREMMRRAQLRKLDKGNASDASVKPAGHEADAAESGTGSLTSQKKPDAEKNGRG